MWCDVMWCDVMWCDVMWYDVMMIWCVLHVQLLTVCLVASSIYLFIIGYYLPFTVYFHLTLFYICSSTSTTLTHYIFLSILRPSLFSPFSILFYSTPTYHPPPSSTIISFTVIPYTLHTLPVTAIATATAFRGVDVSHYQHVYADVIKTYDNYGKLNWLNFIIA